MIFFSNRIAEVRIMIKPPSLGVPTSARIQADEELSVKMVRADPFRSELRCLFVERKVGPKMMYGDLKTAQGIQVEVDIVDLAAPGRDENIVRVLSPPERIPDTNSGTAQSGNDGGAWIRKQIDDEVVLFFSDS